MTLQTENVEIAGLNQVRIRGAMRRMARNATLCLDRLVFENEWSLLVDVASKADRILSRRGAQLLSDETTMRVMTIHALHQSFFHAHRHPLIEDETFALPVFVPELFLVGRNATVQLEDVAKPALPQQGRCLFAADTTGAIHEHAFLL